MNCPHHDFLEKILLQIFYRVSDKINKSIVDNAISGLFVKQYYEVASSFFNQVASLSRGWHIKDPKLAVGAPYPSFMYDYQRCQLEERHTNLIQVISHFKLLTKHVSGASIGRANVIDSSDTRACEKVEEDILDDNMSFLPNNSQGFHVFSKGKGGNQGQKNKNQGML